MLLKKEGFPENEELVLCSVTGVNPHSVFCTLDEYGGRTGMIHISEVAPGRIRNIREHVQEGKKVVCKVLQVHKEKGHIDLSLRRVNDNLKRKKLNQIKQEQLAEKIIEYVAKQEKKKPAELYKSLSNKILQEYETIFAAFEDVVQDALKLETITDKKTAQLLTETIKARIKPPEVCISGEFTLSTHASDGLEQIKATLKIAEKAGVVPHYLGAGTYHIEVKAEDYKQAEKILKSIVEPVLEFAEKKKIAATWTRKEE